MKARARLSHPSSSSPLAIVLMLPILLALAGCTASQSGNTTSQPPTVSVSASPGSITAGSSSTLTVTAANATQVTLTGNSASYNLSATGGTQSVSPTATTTYTATATGKGGTASATATVTVSAGTAVAVTITANPTSIPAGNSSTLTISTANATALSVTGSDGTTYTVPVAGGKQTVSPTATTTYTAKATGASGSATDTATVTVTAGAGTSSVNHVIFMMQENHTFDNYFGMLNPYRATNKWNVGDDGNTYNVDGIDPSNTLANINNVKNVNDQGVSYPLFKLASTCIDDATSGWLESYGDMNRYDFAETRKIKLDGFVHDAQGYAASCIASGHCSGDFTDATGQRVMGYYDQDYLNYYYYMASQFALSDRWFSPVSAKSTPNRLATITGGTTQGLVFDPGADDHIGQRPINSIFEALDKAGVSWKVYYTDTAGQCLDPDDCPPTAQATGLYPATTLTYLTYFQKYLKLNPTHAACVAPTVASSAVGDTSNSFCIDPTHVAWLSQYFTDLTNGTLPAFAYVEAGYGQNDEHPGSFQPVLLGQAQMAKIINAFMGSSAWNDSIFFFAYDEGGGPYDHVPPVPGHSNDKTDPSMLPIPDIKSISVNPDVDPNFWPCLPPSGMLATAHCDLKEDDPGALSGQAPYEEGFAAQLGFRVPNFVVSPFSRRHYVSHIPMDHTAVLKFVEDRFIGNKVYLTKRDAAQPDLLDFFDFNTAPWATPPTPPTPVTDASLNKNTCTPSSMGP